MKVSRVKEAASLPRSSRFFFSTTLHTIQYINYKVRSLFAFFAVFQSFFAGLGHLA